MYKIGWKGIYVQTVWNGGVRVSLSVLGKEYSSVLSFYTSNHTTVLLKQSVTRGKTKDDGATVLVVINE